MAMKDMKVAVDFGVHVVGVMVLAVAVAAAVLVVEVVKAAGCLAAAREAEV